MICVKGRVCCGPTLGWLSLDRLKTNICVCVSIYIYGIGNEDLGYH